MIGLSKEELRREKARGLRYKRAVCAELNLDSIQSTLMDIVDQCDTFRYYFESDDSTMLDELIGDEEESWELRNAFSMLSADCMQMQGDMEDAWVPEFFDDFFGSLDCGRMMGWDSYEGDYFGLADSWDERYDREECRKRLLSHTKAEMVDAYSICFRVALNYISLRQRYDSLKAYTDILNGVNTGLLATVKRLEELYDQNEGTRFSKWDEFDTLAASLPQEVWIQ